jgi:hypothetical protein
MRKGLDYSGRNEEPSGLSECDLSNPKIAFIMAVGENGPVYI